MEEVREGLHRILDAAHPMTVRQVFYQAVVAGLVDKTEVEYQRTVARLLLDMRRDGDLPYSWLADSTRWIRKPRTYTGLTDFIDRHQQAYRRDLWAEADTYVEIWCEKEALAGVLHDITEIYDVPLMVSRGFASESYLYSAADAIVDQLVDGKAKAYVYYFGDFDPSGLKISESIESGLRRLCRRIANDFEESMLSFERVGVTEAHIRDMRLPTRPTKRAGNKHAHDWPDGRPSVELDAIQPSVLRDMVKAKIEQHVDEDQLVGLRVIEEHEREQLRIFGRQVSEWGAP